MFFMIDGRKYIKILTVLVVGIAGLLFLRYMLSTYLFPYKYTEYIEKYADAYNIDADLVRAVILVESRYNTDALSHKNAKGLMQITDGTGAWAAQEIGISSFSPEMLYESRINIQIGCWYINRLLKQFGNDINVVLAAYNGGSGNVSRWLKDPELSSDGTTLDDIPFAETKNYVDKVMRKMKTYKFLDNVKELLK